MLIEEMPKAEVGFLRDIAKGNDKVQFTSNIRAMSILPYQIRSIKCSVKIPVPIDLSFVEKRCKELNAKADTYPNFVVFSVWECKDLPPSLNKNIKYILFRYGRNSQSQHCNICGITDPEHVLECVKLLAKVIQLDQSQLSHTIDNFCATTKLPTKINKIRFVRINPCAFQQFERFPAIFLRSKSKVVILIYASGSVVFSGARNTGQIEEAFDYLKSCYAKYMNMRQ